MRTHLLILGALALWACTPAESEAPPSSPGDADAGAATTPDPRPTGDLGPSTVGGPLDNSGGIVPCSRSPADIMAVVGRHSEAINKCLVAGQKHKRLAKGARTVELEFLVMPSGQIEGVQIHDKDTRDNTVQICIGKVLDSTKFPTVKGGTCPVTLPLNVAPPTHAKKPRKR